MIKSLVFYLGTILSLLVSFLLGPIRIKYLSIRGKDDKKAKFIDRLTHKWASFIMKISFANVKVNGLENIPKDEAVLFVSNHQSNLDIPLLMSVIDVPKGFIAKKELESWPIVSYWMKKLRCVFMDRGNMRKSAEAIVEGIKILRSGYSMVIFPEGKRSKGGPHMEFKAGSFKLATKSKVAIVPVSIDGSYKVLSGKGHMVKKSDIIITIHPKIDTKNLTNEEISELPSTVENIVFSVLK